MSVDAGQPTSQASWRVAQRRRRARHEARACARRPATSWPSARRRSGLVLLAVLTLMAIFADVIAPYDPLDNLNGPGEPGRRAEPCIHALYEVPILGAWGCPPEEPETWLGTDGNSRDIFSRVVFGARISMPIGPVVVGVAILIGALIGAVAGFAGGWSDNILMRIMDVLLAFPALVLAIAIVTLVGPGLLNAVAAVVVVEHPAVRAPDALGRALHPRAATT